MGSPFTFLAFWMFEALAMVDGVFPCRAQKAKARFLEWVAHFPRSSMSPEASWHDKPALDLALNWKLFVIGTSVTRRDLRGRVDQPNVFLHLSDKWRVALVYQPTLAKFIGTLGYARFLIHGSWPGETVGELIVA